MRGQVAGVWFGPRATVAEVRSADTGALIATGQVRHDEPVAGDTATDRRDPMGWWRTLVTALGRTGVREIDALAVVGAHPGLVLVDGAGVVLRPVQAWDGAADEVHLLRKKLGMERWARRAGMVPETQSTITRLAWLRRTDRATFARIGMAMAPHEWLTYRLAGSPATDRGSASETGIWSPHTGRWIPEVVELLVPDGEVSRWVGRLPQVLGPEDRADWLDAPVYEQLGLQGRPLVTPGTGEAMALALALDLRVGEVGVGLTERTSVLAPIDEPVVDASGVVHSRASATGGHLAVTSAAGGAAIIDAVAELLDLDVIDVGALAASVDGLPSDLVLIPGIDDRRGAVLAGLDAGTGRAALARAAFDGVACAAAAALDELDGAGVAIQADGPVHLTGPAGALGVHGQALANLLGRTVVLAPGAMAAAGGCIQAAAVLHAVNPAEVAAAWALGQGPEVDPEADPAAEDRRAAYATEYARQERAWFS